LAQAHSSSASKASEAVSLTHQGVVEVERQADELDVDAQKATNVQPMSMKEGVPAKLVTRKRYLAPCGKIICHPSQAPE
jgi:hypothetical protein